MIQLNSDDICVKCLNVSDNQIPSELVNWLANFEPYEYMDSSDLQEHMYNLETVREVLDRHDDLIDEFNMILGDIENLIVENDCAYFRIVKV